MVRSILHSPGLASYRCRPLSSNVRQHIRGHAVPQQSQRLRRELNSHEAAKPRMATAAPRISRTHDLPDQQRKNYLAPSWLPELYWLRQTLVGVSSASRRARSACRRPLSISLSAHRHRNAGGFAQPRRWRRDDCHHAGGSRRVSLRQRRQRNLGARKAGQPGPGVLPLSPA